jgi:hypothetical protein
MGRGLLTHTWGSHPIRSLARVSLVPTPFGLSPLHKIGEREILPLARAG